MLAQAVEAVREIFQKGGWVMWPLLAMSLLSVALSVERLVFWARTHRPGRTRWLESLTQRLRKGDKAAVHAMCAKDASLYATVATGLLDRGSSEAAALELVEGVRPSFERFSTILSTIITAAPLLGILGTVTGIIESFRLVGAGGGAEDPVTDPTQVAAGIAEALITTAFGLVVAVATLFPYALFRASASRCIGRLETLIAAASQGATKQPSTKSGGD